MITVELTGLPEVRAAFDKLREIMQEKAVAMTATDAEDKVFRAADAHTKTGALIRSVFKQQRTAQSWAVGHDLQIAKHALFIQFGTKPHTIVPVNKKALRWVSGSQFVFAKKVNHPGTRADPYLDRVAAEAPAIFFDHVNTLLKGI